jgi:CBS domain containing-hemolysin-like protein
MAVLFSFVVIAILILINGLFVAAEFSIIGVRHSRVEQLALEGNRAARWLQGILHSRTKTDRYIATAQLSITLASLGLGMYAEPAIAHLIEAPLHDWFGLEGGIVHTISFIFALTLITYLHVVVGEMVPKSLALQNAERTVLLLSTPLQFASKLFSIPVTVLNHIGLATLRLLDLPPPGEGDRLYSLGELELIVAESYAEGMLEEYEQEWVANVLDFAEERVEQVMMPRTRMTAIPTTIGAEEMLNVLTSTPFSRLPVYRDGLDDIVGMVHLKDFVRQQLSGEPFDLAVLVREVSFVPETLPVKNLLADFRNQHRQMAIVMDEHGGTLGLVTLEDLLEEVVGEVWDEFDDGQEPLALVSSGHLLADGTVQLEDIEQYVSLGGKAHDIHTVGGLVWAELGRRPEIGDEVVLDDPNVGNISFRVEGLDGLTITKVSIHYPPDTEPGAGKAAAL